VENIILQVAAYLFRKWCTKFYFIRIAWVL